MSEILPQSDQSIFHEGMELEFATTVASVVEKFTRASEVIDNYRSGRGIPGDTKIGDVLSSFILKTDEGSSLQMGDITVTSLDDPSEEPVTISLSDITEQKYSDAVQAKESSSVDLVGLVIGNQQYISEELLDIYGDTTLVLQKSWELTWKRFKDQIRSTNGGHLVDVADFFDNLVELKYSDTFDPMDRLRGSEARKDISATTFYQVMEPHLKRAIQRRGEDNWS